MPECHFPRMIERSRCPKCEIRMMLVGVERRFSGPDLRTFPAAHRAGLPTEGWWIAEECRRLAPAEFGCHREATGNVPAIPSGRRGHGNMERKRRRLFVRDQLRKSHRTRLSRTCRLCGVMASALPEPWRDQDRWLAVQNLRRGRGRLQYHVEIPAERRLMRGPPDLSTVTAAVHRSAALARRDADAGRHRDRTRRGCSGKARRIP